MKTTTNVWVSHVYFLILFRNMDHQEDIRFNRYDYDNLDGAANCAVAIDDLDGDCEDSLHQVGNLFRNREKKRKGSTKASTKTAKAWYWTHDQVMRLITLWEKEECLYRSSWSEYKDKGKRTNALERIRVSLEYYEEEESTGPSVSYISTKLNSSEGILLRDSVET